MKKFHYFILLLVLSQFFIASSVFAAQSTKTTLAPSANTDAIKIALKNYLPELKVDQINPTIVPNLYEIISGHKVFYTDATGRYAILGNLVDLVTKQSITEQKVKTLDFVDWNKLASTTLPLQQVIGTGARKIAVFLDPDCPFCKELEVQSISKQKNLTVYYYFFPLSIHANAVPDSKKILCSQIPDQALVDWLKNGKPLPSKTQCKNADKLTQMIQIARDVVGVEVTPTIVLPDGTLVKGLVPADYLTQLINNAQAHLDAMTPKPESTAAATNKKVK